MNRLKKALGIASPSLMVIFSTVCFGSQRAEVQADTISYEMKETFDESIDSHKQCLSTSAPPLVLKIAVVPSTSRKVPDGSWVDFEFTLSNSGPDELSVWTWTCPGISFALVESESPDSSKIGIPMTHCFRTFMRCFKLPGKSMYKKVETKFIPFGKHVLKGRFYFRENSFVESQSVAVEIGPAIK